MNKEATGTFKRNAFYIASTTTFSPIRFVMTSKQVKQQRQNHS